MKLFKLISILENLENISGDLEVCFLRKGNDIDGVLEIENIEDYILDLNGAKERVILISKYI